MSLLSQRRKLIEDERAKRAKAQVAPVPSTQRTAADVAEAEEYLKKLSKEFGEQNAKMNESWDVTKGTYIPSLTAAGDEKVNPMTRITDKEGAKKLVAEDEAKAAAKEAAEKEAIEEELDKAIDEWEQKLPEDPAEAPAMTAEQASANVVSMTAERVEKLKAEDVEHKKEQSKKKETAKKKERKPKSK